MKEDIVDNTIFNLAELDYNNGVIFHGPPGCGKTMLTTSLINDAHSKGMTTILTTLSNSLVTIKEIVTSFSKQTLVVFEDLESIAPSRKESNGAISEFLQFMNGISSFKNKTVIIATTNYIEWLDEAVKNRPMRFNRKYKFEVPTTSQLDELVDLYLGKEYSEFRHLFYEKNFTGSHISECKRTIELLRAKAIKLKQVVESPEELLTKALAVISTHFGGDQSGIGFEK